MYQPFFGLKQAPFSIAPDPRYLFMSERHREALAHLLYGLEGGGGFVLLSGEIGAGKTTVCRCFLEQVPAHCNVAYIFNPKLSVTELLKTVCDEFGIPVAHEGPGAATVKDFIDPLNTYLLAGHAAGRHSVLIIDEAQNLSAEVLEQLRLLTNLETRERKLLQIILIGQPELRQMLARPELEQLAQRVIARFHLGALSAAESAQYIAHRLAVAGHTGASPFDAAALRRIHHHARGVPRRINLLADRALLGAYASGQARVDARIVDRAAAEVFDAGLAEGQSAPRAWAAVGVLAAAAAVGTAFWLGQGGRGAQVVSPAAVPSQALAAAPRPASAALAAAAASAVASAAATSGVPPSAVAAASAPVALALDSLDLAPAASRWPDEDGAWRALAARWPALAGVAQPCQAPGWACFRGRSTLPQLRQLDRPVLLWLGAGRGVPVLLLALGPESATLRSGERALRVSTAALATQWGGEFATLWPLPPGYEVAPVAGQAGPVVDWLAAGLARWRGEPAPAAGTARFDAALKAQVQGFQRAFGLGVDGVAGPGTCMQLQRVMGEPMPRLGDMPTPVPAGAAPAPSPSAAPAARTKVSDVLHP
jgi:general secretion pathway protein A